MNTPSLPEFSIGFAAGAALPSPCSSRPASTSARVKRPGLFLAAALMAVLASLANAEEVTLPFQGLTLNADFDTRDGSQAEHVILITHGGFGHWDQETIAYFRSLLRERGYSTLAINLSLGLDDRHGLYDCSVTHQHRNEDAVDEIDTWVQWLRARGTKRVTLFGYSRGGAQTALYAAERDSPSLSSVVLLAPATRANSDADVYQRRNGQSLAPRRAEAERLLEQNRGKDVLKNVGMLWCKDTSATAESFASYHGKNAKVDTLNYIADIPKPTLVIVAENDEEVVGLEDAVGPLVDDSSVHMAVIAGSDHWFRDLNADDAVDAMESFLQQIGE